jgi:hypothetical protein
MKPLIESNSILAYYLPNTNRFNSGWRSLSGGNFVSSIPSANFGRELRKGEEGKMKREES